MHWQPQYGGAVLWARGLKERLQSEIQCLKNPRLIQMKELDKALDEQKQVLTLILQRQMYKIPGIFFCPPPP